MVLRSTILALLLMSVVALAFPAAAQIVPDVCRGPKIFDNPSGCTLCHIGVMAINITNFLMFNIAIPAVALLVAIGGIMLLVSGGSETRITKGKDILRMTVIGAVIVFLAWLGVDTMIKVLVGGGKGAFTGSVQNVGGLGPWNKIDPTGCPLSAGVQTPTTPAATPTPSAPTLTTTPSPLRAAHDAVLQQLTPSGIQVTSSGNCNDPNNASCTSLAGLPPKAISGLKDIKTFCLGCKVIVTGGTEVGHREHGSGQPVVDLAYDPALARFLKSNAENLGIEKVCAPASAQAYSYNCNTPEANHLHIKFR